MIIICKEDIFQSLFSCFLFPLSRSQFYVGQIAQSFDDGNNRIRMGAYFTRSQDVVPFQSQLSVFGNQVLAVPRPASITTNFLTTATAAINYFWPTARRASDPPRYLLTLVGSSDAQGTWTGSLQTTFDTLRVIDLHFSFFSFQVSVFDYLG